MSRWALFLAACFTMLAPRAAIAQESDHADRKLLGHTFIEPQTHPSAMITSHAGIRQGLLFRRIPAFPLGPFGTRTLMQLGADEVLDGGLRTTDWLGFYGRAHVVVHTGINAESILLLPTYSSFALESGAVVRLGRWEESGSQLSLRVGAEASRGYVLHLSALLEEVIASVNQGSAQTLTDVAAGDIAKYVLWPTEGIGGLAWLHGAQALSPGVSFQLSLGARYARYAEHPFKAVEGARVDLQTTQRSAIGALAFTLDAGPSGLPVAATGEWRVTRTWTERSAEGAEGATLHALAGGLHYTGRDNLQLGVGLETLLNQPPERGFSSTGGPADSGTPTTILGSFTLRYIW